MAKVVQASVLLRVLVVLYCRSLCPAEGWDEAREARVSQDRLRELSVAARVLSSVVVRVRASSEEQLTQF